MFNSIKQFFGFGPKVDFSAMLRQGAQILDVRSKGEYAGGHIKGSINISLDTLASHVSRLKKDKPVIICCASGMRSASAVGILKGHGFNQVYNGGGWTSLQNKIA